MRLILWRKWLWAALMYDISVVTLAVASDNWKNCTQIEDISGHCTLYGRSHNFPLLPDGASTVSVRNVVIFLIRSKKMEQYNLKYCACLFDKVFLAQTLPGAWTMEHEGSTCKTQGSRLNSKPRCTIS